MISVTFTSPKGDYSSYRGPMTPDGDKTYSFLHTLQNFQTGEKENTLYKGCKFVSTKARCQCGFTRITKKGYLSEKQVQDIKKHLTKKANRWHEVRMTIDAEAKERIPIENPQ